jgi:hypothetical protein
VASVDDKVNRTLCLIRSRIYRLREAVRAAYIRSAWIRKEEMLADVLTKCMHAPSFLPFRDKLVVAAPAAAARTTATPAPVAAPVAAPAAAPVPTSPPAAGSAVNGGGGPARPP